MGRGTSKASGSSISAMQVTTQSGDIVDLEKPLIYGKNDSAVNGAERATIELQEKKRRGAKIEYGFCVDSNGGMVGYEVRGGSGSVRTPVWMMSNASVFTHNHPRGGANETGIMGGTFSTSDLNNFANYGNVKTYRAAAAEGTYSISKGAKFNSSGFKKMASDNYSKSYSAYESRVKGISSSLGYDDYLKARRTAFNSFLTDLHNGLLANQKAYGYSYTLERK